MRSDLFALKAGVAVTALAFALPTASFAFDDVHWKWNTKVKETVTIDIDIDANIDPPNVVQIEKTQLHWGDVTASAHVDNIQNNAHRPVEGGTFEFSEDFEARFSDTINYTNTVPGTETANNPFEDLPQDLTNIGGASGLNATVTAGTVDEQEGEIDIDLAVSGTVTGEIEIPPSAYGALDAVDLPRIVNAATAVGNNQSIESTSALLLHDGQFVVGAVGGGGFAAAPLFANGGSGGGHHGHGHGRFEPGNTHADMMREAIEHGLAGAIQPAEISADASVGGYSCGSCEGDGDAVAMILNASVDNAATAVANNMSINLDGADAASNTMVADLTQFAYANVGAYAEVNNVHINGYGGFGDAGHGNLAGDITPIVKNAATAVGNNMSIKVGVPTMD